MEMRHERQFDVNCLAGLERKREDKIGGSGRNAIVASGNLRFHLLEQENVDFKLWYSHGPFEQQLLSNFVVTTSSGL